MPRPMRIEFPGAIYHVMSRGHADQDIVLDDVDRRRLINGLERVVDGYGWEVLSFVLMTDHLHLFLKTPQPNLSRGMQQWLSDYANWWCKCRGHEGRVFRGRFKTDLVENDSHYWAVSRYIHLNPVRAGLVTHPADWAWSSYPGYAQRRRALPWVRYGAVWNARHGESGGSDPARAYRRYVEQGIEEPPSSPFEDARHGWILGSRDFVKQARRILASQSDRPKVARSRSRRAADVRLVFQLVADHFGLEQAAFGARNRNAEMRSVAAWLAKRHTQATLSDLAKPLGLGSPQSVGNLTRRIELALPKSRKLSRTIKQLEAQLLQHQEKIQGDAARREKKKKKK